ncbi:uncharacterized protein LOC116660032 [Camelus ferus]|uniref:Uncharacterized protein LOC116660032 n=1 Tax=Camelus ferus TaxID=419612 RepID=A0A8B8S2J6_CAMFR|nr:uncharacterized protein LOC116660032 [Camelus ferus]
MENPGDPLGPTFGLPDGAGGARTSSEFSAEIWALNSAAKDRAATALPRRSSERQGVRLQPTPLLAHSAAEALGTQQRRFSVGPTARNARLGAAAATSVATPAAERSRSPTLSEPRPPARRCTEKVRLGRPGAPHLPSGSAPFCGSRGRGRYALSALWCLRFILSCICLPSVARPGGAVASSARSSSPPCAPETAGLPVPSFSTRAAHKPGAARDPDRAGSCLAGDVCAVPGARPHFPASRQQRDPERLILGSALSWCEGRLPPGWRKQHPSRLYPPQAQNPTLRRGWRLLLPPLKSTRSNSGKEMSREGEGWEDQIRDGSVPANHTRSLPGPPVLGCPNYLLRLERCLAGSGALGSKPHSALLSPAPPHDPAGIEVSFLEILRFILSFPLWFTVQSKTLRSVASSHDQNGTGGAMEQSWTCGHWKRQQDSAVFPAPSPPLCPAPPPFFLARGSFD